MIGVELMPKLQKSRRTRWVVKIALGLVALFGVIGIVALLLQNANMPVLMPKGVIADKERQLLIIATLLGLIVVVPVFIMLFFVAWKYREGNAKAKYSPNWDSNRWIEGLWWGIPLIIISVLGVIAWQSSHELDPYKSLVSNTKPVKIQVIALQWKWLFLYPDQGVASTNMVNFPVNTPVDFEITADAPMNSFWIPSLGSQVYAMTGMSTELHLQANDVGSYDGRSANISGEGFADMQFSAHAMLQTDFNQWAEVARQSSNPLTLDTYTQLAQPSREKSPRTYVLRQSDLYDTIVMKYMGAQ
jgi:cytochrome o ubiquinol oxidase subunit 2